MTINYTYKKYTLNLFTLKIGKLNQIEIYDPLHASPGTAWHDAA